MLLAAVFGLSFAFVTPPFQVPDEVAHLYGAYRVSQGVVQPVKRRGHAGARLPVQIVELPDLFFARVVRGETHFPSFYAQVFRDAETLPKRRKFAGFYNPYSPLSYAPAASGLAVARGAGLPLWLTFYLGRIASLAAWILIVRQAIRWTPVLPEVFWLVALAPMSLFMAASYSADAMTNAVAWLLVAAIFRAAFDGADRVSGGGLAAVAVLSGALAVLKYAYLPLCGLALLIPLAKFGSRRSWGRAMAAVFGAAAVALGVWAYLSRANGIDPQVATGLSARPWSDLLTAPVDFVALLAHTTRDYAYTYLVCAVGQLGLLSVALPFWVIAFYSAAFLAAVLLSSGREVEISVAKRVWSFALPVAVYVGIQVVAWQRWSPPEGEYIVGFQGRYVLPLLPVLALSFYQSAVRLPPRLQLFLQAGLTLGVGLALWDACGAIAARYYGPDIGFFSIPAQVNAVWSVLNS